MRLNHLIRLVRWHRRGVAALALLVAVFAAVAAVTAGRPVGVPMAVAARDLPPGTKLARSDITVVTAPAELVPTSAWSSADELIGRTLAVSLSGGTPITTVALSGAGLVDRAASEVLVPFRVHDPDVVGLLRTGDRITIVATTPEGAMRTVAEHVRVAQLPTSASGGLLSGGATSGALIVVAAQSDVARGLAAAGDLWLGVVIE